VIVEWGGAQVFALSAGGFGLEDTEWARHSAVVTATGSEATLRLSDVSPPDQVGTYVDNLPEPDGSMPLFAAALLIAGLTRIR
jgi:hypothetical protein